MLPIFSYISLLFLCSNILARTPPFRTLSPQNNSSISENHSYSWHEFRKFQDSRKGSSIDGISKLKRYFNKFGYLEAYDLVNSTDTFDSSLERAIAKYQHNFGLKVTKKIDIDTLTEITKPRCGVRDISSNTLIATRKFEYFTGQPRWRRDMPMTLTYAISPRNVVASPSVADIRGALERAFSHWAKVIPVEFVETGDYGFADIKIGFYAGDHGDGEAFDGVLGVLAHAFSPESGRFHLDAAETWAADLKGEKAASAVDLESVATHEIGHLLGLAHSRNREAVMYPSLRPRERKVELRMDDIRGVQALYGSNPNFSMHAFSESEMYSNEGADDRRVGEGGIFWRVNWAVVLALWLCM